MARATPPRPHAGTVSTLAVDLGGTHTRVAVVDASGRVLDRHETLTPHDRGADALIELMRDVHGDTPCGSAVVGVPGRVDYTAGTLEYAPNLPPGWLAELTGERLGRALAITVSLANDADLAAVGEAWFGAGDKHRDIVYVTFSTGVGAGVVLGRRLVHGRRSLAEVGHTILDLSAAARGRPATVEELASGRALGRLASDAGLSGSGPDTIAAVRRAEPGAAAVWDRVTAAAGAAVVNLAWLFSPEVVVVGGGLGLVGDLLLDPIRAALAASGPPGLDEPIAVVNATLGDDAGLAGAAAWSQAFVR